MGSEEGRLSRRGETRIAYVVSRFPKLTETFVLYEALALRRQGFAITICPLIGGREAVEHPEAEALESDVLRVPAISGAVLGSVAATLVRHPLRLAAAVLAALRGAGPSARHLSRAVAIFPKTVHLARELERLEVRHVHAHFANHPALCASVIHALTGIPFSFTAHGSDLHRDTRGLRDKISRAAFAVTVSRYNRGFIAERVGESAAGRVEVLFCGADVLRFGSLGQGRRPRAEDEPLRIACVAALRTVKGHTFLLGALEILRRRGVRLRCDLAGSGPLEGSLRDEIQRRGLADCVHLAGPLDRDAIESLLRAAHVITLTSIVDAAGRREGIPVSLMEGMASGLPAVASRQSGIPELVEDGVSGLLAEPGDSESIADAFERLARDPERAAAMGQRGRERVLADFDLERNAARLAARIAASFPARATAQGAAPPRSVSG